MRKQAVVPPRALGDTPHNHVESVDVFGWSTSKPAHQPADKEDGTKATFGRLSQLPYMEEDEDCTRPTLYAFEAALNLLLSTRDMLRQSASDFPRASFGTTDKGSILIYWRKPGRSVQAVIPFQENGHGYIHVLEGSAPTIYDNLEGPALAKALEEFSG